jgi:hypothetical protein
MKNRKNNLVFVIGVFILMAFANLAIADEPAYGNTSNILGTIEEIEELNATIVPITESNETQYIMPLYKETVTCVFKNTDQKQECYSEKGSCTAYPLIHPTISCKKGENCSTSSKDQISCSVDVEGLYGEKITWKSTCGSYEYTKIDGKDEKVKFKCPDQPAAECKETDNGADYFNMGYIKGYTKDGTFVTSYDQCYGNTLTEWHCQDGYVADPEKLECKIGCEDGRCIKQECNVDSDCPIITCAIDCMCVEGENCTCPTCPPQPQPKCIEGKCIYNPQAPSLDLLTPETYDRTVKQNGVTFAQCGKLDTEWCNANNPDAEGTGPFQFLWGDGEVSCSWFAAKHTYDKDGSYTIKVGVRNTCGLESYAKSQVYVDENISTCKIPACEGAYYSGDYDEHNCPVYYCPPIACSMPSCEGAYETGEYDEYNCPIYKCPIQTCEVPICDGVYKTGEMDINNCPIYACPPIEDKCDGCLIDGRCILQSTRLNLDGFEKYCDVDYTWKIQKDANEKCNNNYECGTNMCFDSKCVSSTTWQKLLRWLEKIFK